MNIEAFRLDGVALLHQVLRPEWIELLAQGVEHNRTMPSAWAHRYTNPDESVGFWSDYGTWTDVDQYQRVVYESGLADVAAQLMESSTARFFHEHVLVKEAGASERTPWHHDLPYYSVAGEQNVSMWIALDPVALEICPRFIAGSHRWDRLFIPRRFVDHLPYGEESDVYEQIPDIDSLIESDPQNHRVIKFNIEPGDVIAFQFRTLHDAPGNTSLTTRRRAVSLRWLGDDAVWAERPWQVSPPYEPEGLAVGDSLDARRFPLVVG